MDELTNELGVEWAMSNDTNGIKPKYAEKPTPVPRHSPKSYTHWPGTEPGSLQWQDALYRPSHGTAFSYRGADKSLARPGRKQANVSIRMAWISFGALPCRKKKNLTAHVSMLLKSRASLTCFRARFLPGRAKDLSASRYFQGSWSYLTFRTGPYLTFHLLRACFHSSFTISITNRQRRCMATFRTTDE